MEFDEIHLKRLNLLREDLIIYIEEEYLKGFSLEDKVELDRLLALWDRDGLMIDYILIAVSAEGKLNFKDIEKKALDKNISRVVFSYFIEDVIKETDFNKLNFKKEFKEIEIKIMAKEFVLKNCRELFIRKVKSLNKINIKIENKKFFEMKDYLNVVK